MKKLTVGLLLFLPLVLQAQEWSDESSMIQSLFGSDKRNIVSEFVGVEGNNRIEFLKLYDAYEQNRKTLGQKKFTLLNNYVKNYKSLTEAETEEVMKEIMLLSSGQEKLVASFYKKIKKKCGVVAAAQFYQIEWYLLSEIRTAVLESIPIINQLENKK
ncbi:MAG: hypothetical protein ACOYW3_15750 [Bacteroidota bacterium]